MPATQPPPPVTAIAAAFAAAPNVTARRCAGLHCARVRFGEDATIHPGHISSTGEMGDVLEKVLSGINAGEFRQNTDGSWTRTASDGWVLYFPALTVTPTYTQTLFFDGERPTRIVFRADYPGVMQGSGVRSFTWTIDYARLTIGGRSIDVPDKSFVDVETFDAGRSHGTVRFSDYRLFTAESRVSYQ